MDKIKVKIVCWWDTDVNISNIFREIWMRGDIIQKIELVTSEDYEYLIVLNDYRRDKNSINCPIENRIAFIMEPSWSMNWDRRLGDYVSKIYSHINFNPKCEFNPSVMSTHLFPKPINIGEIQYVDGFIDKVVNTDFIKTKKLSIVVSDINHYKRYNFVKKLLDSNLEFEMFGRGWNLEDPRYKGYVTSKIDAIKDFEFSICLENSNEYGYVSEKFIDSALCGTVPIYYGSSDIEEWYGDCFEYIDIEDVNAITNLEKIISSPKKYDFSTAKKFYLEKNNPFKILLEYIESKQNN